MISDQCGKQYYLVLELFSSLWVSSLSEQTFLLFWKLHQTCSWHIVFSDAYSERKKTLEKVHNVGTIWFQTITNKLNEDHI